MSDYIVQNINKIIPEKCTGVYVGRKVSAEGTTIIARSEDQKVGAYNKIATVIPAKSGRNRFLEDTGAEQNHFSVIIPDETYKFTTLFDDESICDGPFHACCTNEFGLAVTATVSTEVSSEYAELDPLKKPGEGIREAILAAIPVCQTKTAAEAIRITAAYIDKYGSCECNTVMVSDTKEAWVMEIYGGTTYAAMRLPEDKMAVFGNQIMLGWVDFKAEDGYLFSGNLEATVKRCKHPIYDENGRCHLARTIAADTRRDYSNLRTWRGHQLFAPHSTEEYNTNTFYPLLFDPEKKVSVLDVMNLFGDRYEGTVFDMSLPENKGNRPIGVERQGNVHIIQTYANLPLRTCQLVWLAMGNAEHCVFVPMFSGITETYEKYRVSNTEPNTVNDSYYYICRKNAALAETDRFFLGSGLKEFNRLQQKEMFDSVNNLFAYIIKQYKISQAKGDAFVTAFCRDWAEKQYDNALAVYQKLCFAQMYNTADWADEEKKLKFSMQ